MDTVKTTSTVSSQITTNEEKVFDIKITKKKMRDTLIKSIISTIISYLVVYFAKFGINIPEELQLELVVGGVLFFNTCIEGVRNWWTHRKMGKEDKK